MGLTGDRPGGFLRAVRTTRHVPATWAVLSNAASLVGTFAVTSVLGMAFWLVAAHYYSRSVVGLSGGLISAMMLIGQLCTLGLNTMLIGEIPRRRTPSRTLVASAMAASGAAGAVGGLLFALIAPTMSDQYHPLVASFSMAVMFTVGVALTASARVFDGATIGALRGGLQLWRNGLFAAAKLTALLVLAAVASNGDASLLGAWLAGVALSLLCIFAATHRRTIPLGLYRPRLGALRGRWSDAFGQQAFNVSFNVPVLVLPLVVLGLVSAAANASFYIALQLAAALYIVPNSLTTVLFAVGTLEPWALATRLRLTLLLSTVVSALGILVVALAGGPVLGVFGSSYRDGAPLLLVLALASVPLTAKGHYLSITRIEQRVTKRLPLVWTGACLEIGGAVAGAALGGSRGVAFGWLVALCAEAAVMTPVIWRNAVGKGGATVGGPDSGDASLSSNVRGQCR